MGPGPGRCGHGPDRSASDAACVEVATNLPGVVAVRDSKDSTGPLLTFTAHAWTGFIAAAKRGGRAS
ncbi:DUF397 domain-containing protein [Micromonospora chokoriensis]